MAIRSNIFIDQGTNVEFTYNVTNDDDTVMDLTGFTGKAQMRKHYSSSNAHTFTVAIDANNGIVTMTMNANTTGNIKYGRYVYDCEITSNGVVSRIVEGIATVRPQVTQI